MRTDDGSVATAALRVAAECNSSELKFMNFMYWPWSVTARVEV